MIHYHGTPCGGKRASVPLFLKSRHALISFARQEDLCIAAGVSSTLFLTMELSVRGNPVTQFRIGANIMNGLTNGENIRIWDWAAIPDVIDGDEAATTNFG